MRVVLLASLPPLPFLGSMRARAFLRPDGLGDFRMNFGADPAGVELAGIVVKFMAPGRSIQFLRQAFDRRSPGNSEPPRGRLAAYAESLQRQCRGARTVYTTDFHSARTLRALHDLAPDLCVYLGGSDLLRPVLLGIPRLGVIGSHYALLPRLRGMNVTEWAVLLNEPVGVAVQRMAAGVDTGEIILQEQLTPRPADTLDSLRTRSHAVARELLIEAIALLAEGLAEFTPQKPDAGRQYFRMHHSLRSLAAIRLRIRSARADHAGLLRDGPFVDREDCDA